MAFGFPTITISRDIRIGPFGIGVFIIGDIFADIQRDSLVIFDESWKEVFWRVQLATFHERHERVFKAGHRISPKLYRISTFKCAMQV